MSDPLGSMATQLPRPGRVLRGVLWTVAALAVFWAVWVHWIPGGVEAFSLLVFSPSLFLHGQVWRLFTAGLLSPPSGPGAVSHLLFTLIGLYFLSPDLERRWGGLRFGVFLAKEILLLHHGEIHAGPGMEGTEILLSFKSL